MANFNLTASGIIRTSYQLAGIIPAGSDPDSNQTAMGRDFLNTVLADMQNYGIMLRKLERTTATLSSGVSQYTTASDTLDIDGDQPYVSDGNGTDIPVIMIRRGEYMALTQKSITGQPTMMYVEKADPVSFFLYPTPDSTWVSLVYPRVILLNNLTTGAAETGLQAKYLKSMQYGLAELLSYAHGMVDKAGKFHKVYIETFGQASNDDTERGTLRFIPRYGVSWE